MSILPLSGATPPAPWARLVGGYGLGRLWPTNLAHGAVDFASVRSNAASTVGEIGGPEAAKAIPTLERLATSDPYPETKANARRALEQLKSSKSPSPSR